MFQVWTCGLNTYRVLAHSPPPVSLLAPRVVNPKFLKALGGPILGICAARYHSVFWSKSAVLTCGLHGGQLGHPALPDATITIPRQVRGVTVPLFLSYVLYVISVFSNVSVYQFI